MALESAATNWTSGKPTLEPINLHPTLATRLDCTCATVTAESAAGMESVTKAGVG